MESRLSQSRMNLENMHSVPDPNVILRDLHLSKDKIDNNGASTSISQINMQNFQNEKSYIQPDLDGGSLRNSLEKNDVLSILAQQQVENRRLSEQNQFLTTKLSSLLEHTNTSSIQNNSYSIFNQSRNIKPDIPNMRNRKQFLNDSDALRPNLDIKNVYRNLNQNEEREDNLYYSPYGNQESTFTNQDVILLQNHIVLLEKENDLLKREISMAKQQEIVFANKIQESDLNLLRYHEETENVFRENQELKELLRQTTEEANFKLMKLGDLNNQFQNKINTYTKVIEKLSNEIYNFSKLSGLNSGRNDLQNSNLAMKSYNENIYPQTDRTYKQDDGEIMNLRQENFQLKADIKALSELLSGSKDDRVLSEKKNVNFYENIQPFEVSQNMSQKSPLSNKKTPLHKYSNSAEIKKRSNSVKESPNLEEISPIKYKNQNSMKIREKQRQIIPQAPFRGMEK
jgi:hypothetical protein